MHHHTRTITLASALMLVSVALLGGTKLLHSQGEVAAEPQPSKSSFQGVAHPLDSSGGFKPATKTRDEAFQKEADEANRLESIANKKAQQLFEEGRLAEAEQACYDALAVSLKINGEPTGTTAMQLLGDVYREQGRYKEAIEMYGNSTKHGSGDEAVNPKTAWCYLKLGDMKNARKFYSEKRFFADVPPNRKANYFSMLPGDKTPKTMEASLFYAMGCVKDLHGEPEKANALWKKTLAIVPHNALAARQIAWNLDFLGRRDEAATYWARAAVFGKGDIAKDGRREVRNHLMPDKAAQALRDAKKIR